MPEAVWAGQVASPELRRHVVSLPLRDGVVLDESELQFRFVRASGPGGQNVNKVATKAELRFQLADTPKLSDLQKERLRLTFPSYVTRSGELLIASDVTRSQSLNQADALDRLRQMILSIWLPPKPRRATKPSAASVRRRVQDKRYRSTLKKLRTEPKES